MVEGTPLPAGPAGVVRVPHPLAPRALLMGLLGVVLGALCGVGGIVGLLGVLTGREARRDIDAYPDRYDGRAMATAGLVTGIVGLGVGLVVTVTVVVVVLTGRAS